MVAKTDLLTAAESIEKALQAFAHGSATAKALVFESYPGHLRALVGSDGFKGMSPGARQDVVWKHLRDQVNPEYLVYLYGVRPMDLDEYDAHISRPESASNSLEMFIRGATPIERSDD